MRLIFTTQQTHTHRYTKFGLNHPGKKIHTKNQKQSKKKLKHKLKLAPT